VIDVMPMVNGSSVLNAVARCFGRVTGGMMWISSPERLTTLAYFNCKKLYEKSSSASDGAKIFAAG